MDLLHKGVTEKFIEVTMEGYEKSFGREFGGVVPGVFTDEPNIEVQGKDNIRWTPDLFDRFKERWGYDLVPHLPSMVTSINFSVTPLCSRSTYENPAYHGDLP